MPGWGNASPYSVVVSKAATGWLFVVLQVILLVLLVLLPQRNDWPTPTYLVVLSWILSFIGAAVVLLGAGRLGRSLTPTPVPVKSGELAMTGVYRYMRHPIYTGVLTIVAGIVLRSGSIAHALVGVLTVAFFTWKSSWEEAQLREQYSNYEEYAATVPRFLPKVSP